MNKKETLNELEGQYQRALSAARDKNKHFKVYFIQENSEEGFIKIGLTNDIETRLSGLQIGNPRTLRLLVTLDGGISVENKIHRTFAEYLVRGEWYRPAPELVQFIAELLNDV